MAMTRFEKMFVNRERKANRNIGKVRTRLKQLDVENLHDALELGCGIGSVSAYLSENYQMNVIGTDFDPAQIEIAKRRYAENDKLKFKIEDVSNLSFIDASFDLVLSQNVFHHVLAWEEAVREVSRVLRPGGYFIWLDLTFPKYIVELFQPLVKNYGLYTYEGIMTEFTKNKFVALHEERSLFTHHLVFQKREI
jgi:ubiquinone/menaquinone biosynthesis C-methylase UbiE